MIKDLGLENKERIMRAYLALEDDFRKKKRKDSINIPQFILVKIL